MGPRPTSGKTTHYGKKGQWFSDGEFYPFDSHDKIYQWNANAGYSHSWYNDQGYVDENETQVNKKTTTEVVDSIEARMVCKNDDGFQEIEYVEKIIQNYPRSKNY